MFSLLVKSDIFMLYASYFYYMYLFIYCQISVADGEILPASFAHSLILGCGRNFHVVLIENSDGNYC